MKKTSSVATGSATAAAAAIAPLIDWIANGRLKWDMPSPVVLIFSAAFVTIGHFIVNMVNQRNLLNAPPSGSAPTVVTKEGGYMRLAILPFLALFAAGAIVITGCGTSPLAQKTPQQTVAEFCQITEFTVASLSTMPSLPPAASENLQKAMPIIATACGASATIDITNIQALATTAMPALLSAINAAGLSAADHAKVLDALDLAQLGLNLALINAGKPPVTLLPLASQ